MKPPFCVCDFMLYRTTSENFRSRALAMSMKVENCMSVCLCSSEEMFFVVGRLFWCLHWQLSVSTGSAQREESWQGGFADRLVIPNDNPAKAWVI